MTAESGPWRVVVDLTLGEHIGRRWDVLIPGDHTEDNARYAARREADKLAELLRLFLTERDLVHKGEALPLKVKVVAAWRLKEVTP